MWFNVYDCECNWIPKIDRRNTSGPRDTLAVCRKSDENPFFDFWYLASLAHVFRHKLLVLTHYIRKKSSREPLGPSGATFERKTKKTKKTKKNQEKPRKPRNKTEKTKKWKFHKNHNSRFVAVQYKIILDLYWTVIIKTCFQPVLIALASLNRPFFYPSRDNIGGKLGSPRTKFWRSWVFWIFDRCRGWLERSAGCQRSNVLVSDTLSLVEKYFCFADHALGNKEIELEMICKTRFSHPKTRFSRPKSRFSRFFLGFLGFFLTFGQNFKSL